MKKRNKRFMVGEGTWDHFPCATQIIYIYKPNTHTYKREKKEKERRERKNEEKQERKQTAR